MREPDPYEHGGRSGWNANEEDKMESTFFAAISRMKYIERWALMRSSRAENLSEHSLEVSMIAHVLCLIGNVRYGRARSQRHGPHGKAPSAGQPQMLP